MGDDQSTHDDQAAEETRAPYEAPAIEDSAEYETLALTCGFAYGKTCAYGGGYTTS